MLRRSSTFRPKPQQQKSLRSSFFRDGLVKTVEVTELGDVGLYTDDIRADFREGLVEFGLPAAGDKNVGPLFNELLCGREADAAATPVTREILFFNEDTIVLLL